MSGNIQFLLALMDPYPDPEIKLNLYSSKLAASIELNTFLHDYLILILPDITKIKQLKNES